MKNLKILGGIGGIVLILFIWQSFFRLPFIRVNPFEAIPHNTAIIADCKDFLYSQMPSDTLASFKVFQSVYPNDKLVEDLKLFRAIVPNAALPKQRLLAALHLGKREALDWILVLDDQADTFNLEQFADTIRDVRVFEYTYLNQKVYDFKPKNRTKPEFSIAKYRNLVVFGRYSLLVEEVINQLKWVNSNLCRSSAFRRVKKKEGFKRGIDIYINFAFIRDSFRPFLSDLGKREAATLNQWISWSKLSLQFDTVQMAIKGGLIPNKDNHFLKAVRDTSDFRLIQQVLPENIAFAHWWNVGKFKRFYGRQSGSQSKLLKKYFMPWIGKECAFVVTQPFSEEAAVEQFILFKIKDKALAEQHLAQLEEDEGIQQYKYQMFSIKQMTAENWLQPLFTSAQWNAPFYTILEDYIVIANDKAALEVWLDKYIVGETLSNNPNFLAMQDTLPQRAGLFSFWNIFQSGQWLKSLFKEKYQDNILEQIDEQKDVSFQGVCLQPSWTGFSIEGNAILSYIPQSKTSIVWKASLSNKATIAPVVFRNTSRKYEIAIQDRENNFYILDNGGNTILKKNLGDRIISRIHPMDFYKNKQQQYLFNTPNAIHLIDNQGQNVGAFPIHLQSAATNGVTVADFNHTKEYSFFIACNNQNIYGFDATGRPLEGWSPRRGAGVIGQPLQHFQRNSQDYLITFSESRKQVLAYKRNGDYRFRSKVLEGSFPSSLGFQHWDLYPRILATNNEGTGYVVNLRGGGFKLNLKAGNNTHVRSVFCDVGGDRRNDYVVMSGKHLVVYYYKGNNFEKLWEYTFEHPQDEIFAVRMPYQRKYYLGTLCKAKKQINLLNYKGELYPDFPLAGTSVFQVVDMFKAREYILVVGHEDSVYAYRLKK